MIAVLLAFAAASDGTGQTQWNAQRTGLRAKLNKIPALPFELKGGKHSVSTFAEKLTPFTDPFARGPTVGEIITGRPSLAVPPRIAGLETPLSAEAIKPLLPALPINEAPPSGHPLKCEGGHVMDASAYNGCSTIEGFLSVSGTKLTSLDDFGDIKTIKAGKLDNAGIGLIISNNPELRSLDGLSNLEGSLPGALVIKNNPKLRSLNGLEGLESIHTKSHSGQSISISGCEHLKHIDGLSGLQGNLDGSLAIFGNTHLRNLNGLKGIEQLGKDRSGVSLQCENNDALTDLKGLDTVISISGAIVIHGCGSLVSLDLQEVTQIGHSINGVSFYFAGNNAIERIDGLRSLNGAVSGSVHIENCPKLKSAQYFFADVVSCGRNKAGQGLVLSNCGNLADATGLKDMSEIKGSITIQRTALTSTPYLTNLKKLGQDAQSRSLVIANNTNLLVFAMPALIECTGSILVFACPTLESMELPHALDTIGADAKNVSFVVKDTGVKKINGGEKLQVLAGAVALVNNPRLKQATLCQESGCTLMGRAALNGNTLQVLGNTALLTTSGLNFIGEFPGAILLENNTAAKELAFKAVTKIGMNNDGRSLVVTLSKKVSSLGFSGLKTLAGGLVVSDTAVADLRGISALESIGKSSAGVSIELNGNQQMVSADGLQQISSLSGGILVQNNQAMKTTKGFGSLSDVGKDSHGRCLAFVNNPQLQKCSFHRLAACGGSLLFAAIGLEDMRCFSALESVGVSSEGKSIQVIGNQRLQSLSGLDQVLQLQGSVELAGNLLLSEIALQLTTIGADKRGNSLTLIDLKNLKSLSGFKTIKGAIAGSIIVQATGVTDIKGIEGITTVGADKLGQSLVLKNNHFLKSAAGLRSIVGVVPGSIIVEGNQRLQEVGSLQQVTSVGADLNGISISISKNAELKSVKAFQAVIEIEGALLIEQNPDLQTLDALQVLNDIKGKSYLGQSIAIVGNNNLENVKELATLEGSLTGSIHIENNLKLTSFASLKNIGCVGKNVYGNAIELISNPVITDVSGFGGLHCAMSGSLVIMNNIALKNVDGFRSIDTLTGKNMGGNAIQIQNNPLLESIEGLANLGGALKGGLAVENNGALESVSTLLQGARTITSATSVSINGVRCLSGDDRRGFKNLCSAQYKNTCQHQIQSVTECSLAIVGSHVSVGGGNGRVCGGITSGDGWNTWKLSGSSGLYIDVKTDACNFEVTPAYVSSVIGDAAHWQLVGVNSIYSASKNKFRVYIWHPVLRGAFMKFFAKKNKWRISWVADTGKHGGLTDPGNTGWKQYAKDTIYVDVDTKLCGYSKTPVYIPSIHGSYDHWRTTGVHSVYDATQTSFRIYVMHASKSLTAADAEKKKWAISWIGSTATALSGYSPSVWKPFCAADDASCTKDSYTTIYMDVKTTSQHFTKTPAYVSALSGSSHHLVATGGGAIYSTSPGGFRVYLAHAPTIEIAAAAKWRVGWVAYQNPSKCVVSEWGTWSSCSQTCAGGTQARKRSVKKLTDMGDCPKKLVGTKKCNTQPCSDECAVSANWTSWSVCTVTCGTGHQSRHKRVLKNGAEQGGCKNTKLLNQTRPCSTGDCPVDCVMGDWSAWSTCTKSCLANEDDSAEQYKVRKIIQAAAYGGTPCSGLKTAKECDLTPCAVDCVVGDWGVFTQCDKSCGSAESVRERNIIVEPHYQGVACPSLEQSQPCSLGTCNPVDCVMGAWSDWSKCSRTCGIGTFKRKRPIDQQSSDSLCPHTEQVEECLEDECPLDCMEGPWDGWSECTKSCTNDGVAGVRERVRKITHRPVGDGKQCKATTQKKDCGTDACPIDCIPGPWAAWASCSATCGEGNHARSRSVVQTAMYGGAGCDATQQGSCNLGDCTQHCRVSIFSGHGHQCSRTCGGGMKVQTRKIISGKDKGQCPALKQTVNCNTFRCPVDCVIGDWGEWKSAVGRKKGTVVRQRSALQSEYGGKVCPAQAQFRQHSCAEHDQVVGDWSGCTKKCGTGYQYRYRKKYHCNADTAHFGIKARQGRHCNTQECATAADAAIVNDVSIPALPASR
jgi:hypothetical protein